MARTPISVLLLAALFALGGCSGEDPPPPRADGRLIPGTCGDGARQQAGEYVVENNVWNKGATTGYNQCVGLRAVAGGGVDVAFEWLWPGVGNGIRAYPEVIYGQKPWNESTSPKLPRVVDDVKAVKASFGHRITNQEGDAGNLTFDIWLTQSNQRSGPENNLPLSHELMIVLDSWGGFTPYGVKVETVEIGGVTWDLYTGTGTWGPNPWQLVTYIPTTAVPNPVTVDIRLFLDHLKQGGRITGKEWLASVELGNEVIRGKGSALLSNFTVTVE